MSTTETKLPALKLIKNQGQLKPTVITRDLRRNPRLCGDFDDLLEISHHRKMLEKTEMKLRKRIASAMGNAEKAVFTHGYAQWVKGRDQIELNTQAVLEQYPALLDDFPQVTVTPPSLQLHGNQLCVEFPQGGEHEYP